MRRKRGADAHIAKLDIRAAFDSVSHAAIVQYLTRCTPCYEAAHLWELSQGNRLLLTLGTDSWHVNVRQGVLQGTSYSADLFSRIIDHPFLGGLQEKWTREFPAWGDEVSLPHYLLYADDVLLFAESAPELQRKLHDLTDCLAAIGLHVNHRKCAVLNVGGATPGVWPRGSCTPLAGRDCLVFLGVPITQVNTPDLMLVHPLRKMNNAYFGMKKLLDSAETDHRTRAVLFESYIASKWTWCASVVWPSVRSLKALEGLKNSLLLGIYRFHRDPFSTWLENVQGCRRALNVYCRRFRGPAWQVTWLTRRGTYMGHLARSEELTPVTQLLRATNSLRLSQGAVKPSWLSESPMHKFRLRFRQIRLPHEPEYWEWLAKDREAWRAMLPRWIASWGVGAALPDSTEYMAGRQLVVLEKGIVALRPRRDALDGLYRKGVVHLQPWRADARCTITVWVTHNPGDIVAGVYFFRPKVKAPETPVVHVGLRPTQQGVEPFAVLNFACKVLELLYLTEPLGNPRIVLPAHLLSKSALEGMQDSRNPDAARFTRVGEEVGLLDKLSLTPKRLPDRWALQLGFKTTPLGEGGSSYTGQRTFRLRSTSVRPIQ